MEPLLALLFTFVLMWVLLIRPQQRRMREHQAVVASLRPGDEIVTVGGIYGTVQSIDDEAMLIRVAPGVDLRVIRAAVSQRVSGTEDALNLDEVSEGPEHRSEEEL